MDGAENRWIVRFPLTLALAAVCGFALLQSELFPGSYTVRHFSPIPPALASSDGYDALPGGAWSVDPRTPGENLPPVGRSLFDFLVTEEVDGKKTYLVPFPFEALTQKIEANLQQVAPRGSSLKQVLIPLGRSLQRSAASPHFFKYPRVIVAVDTEPRAQGARAGMLLKDRLYLGYQEKADIIEVISYNELAGRFEFQVVKDYREGGSPRVFYARRAICMACHQNGGPIFSRQVWDETNANPKIASLLKEERRDFYGIRVDRGVDIPQAIDDATDRANRLSAYQLLWREGCGGRQHDPAAIRRRADVFTFMLQYRLTGDRQFDSSSSRYRDDFAPAFAANWKRRWPGGLYIPDPDIPNRDPLLTPLVVSQSVEPKPGLVSDARDVVGRLVARSDVRSEFEPLNPRPPLATWSASAPGAVARVITGLSESIAALDIRRLDDHLFETALQRGSRRQRYSSTCKFTQKITEPQVYRISLKCHSAEGVDVGTFSMNGRIYVEAGTVIRGVIEQLTMESTATVRDLDVVGGTVEWQNGERQASLHVARDGLHARRANGNAIENVRLRWRSPERDEDARRTKPAYRTFFGDAVVTVMSDFAPVHRAVAQMATETAGGKIDVFSAKPFRRAAVMQALFAQLGMASVEWCCVDGTDLPRAMLDVDDNRGAQPVRVNADQSAVGIAPFYQFCAKCHRTRERFPPNFLYGDASEVSTNLAHCAQRLYFRLSMWQLRPDERPKTPMPPVHALHALGLSPEQWRDSAQLAGLKRYVGDILKSQTGKEPIREAVMARGYETLRGCLPGTE